MFEAKRKRNIIIIQVFLFTLCIIMLLWVFQYNKDKRNLLKAFERGKKISCMVNDKNITVLKQRGWMVVDGMIGNKFFISSKHPRLEIITSNCLIAKD